VTKFFYFIPRALTCHCEGAWPRAIHLCLEWQSKNFVTSFLRVVGQVKLGKKIPLSGGFFLV
ncbi:MAG TPA: hypothetical protein DCM27_01450, partial [Rhodospirillaceae bacterium]|nr:hypothetical protein [Rhodospirillaceae bacterium]